VLDYGARFYGPVIGRFNVIDRFAEKYVSITPYQYAANNPVVNIDINGDSTWTTTRTVTKGNNVTNYYTTHITGKVLKNSTTYGSAGDFASKLNAKLNNQLEVILIIIRMVELQQIYIILKQAIKEQVQ